MNLIMLFEIITFTLVIIDLLPSLINVIDKSLKFAAPSLDCNYLKLLAFIISVLFEETERAVKS